MPKEVKNLIATIEEAACELRRLLFFTPMEEIGAVRDSIRNLEAAIYNLERSIAGVPMVGFPPQL